MAKNKKDNSFYPNQIEDLDNDEGILPEVVADEIRSNIATEIIDEINTLVDELDKTTAEL